jgi:hypothetical protein
MNFLGILIDNHLNWKSHIDQKFLNLVLHVLQLGSVSYFKHRYSSDGLLSTLLFCNKIWNNFWGKFYCCKSRIYITKKDRIMAGVGSRSFCRSLFKNLDILPVPCQYIFSLMFVVDNQESFQTNWSIHGVDARNKTQLHRPIASLSCFQEGVSYAGIKILSSLPSSISNLRNCKLRFKVTLQRYLMDHSFYSLTKHLIHRKDSFL